MFAMIRKPHANNHAGEYQNIVHRSNTMLSQIFVGFLASLWYQKPEVPSVFKPRNPVFF